MKKKTLVASLASVVLLGSLGATVFAASNDGQKNEQVTYSVGIVQEKSKKENKLFQYSTINALMSGQYDGDITLDEVKKHGDFGLGTLNGADGELTEIDSKFYRFDSKGKMTQVKGDLKTPFVVTTNFQAEKTAKITNVANTTELTAKLLEQMDNKNNFYAFKMPVKLTYLKTRSEPKQERPYRLLKDVLAEQQVEFEYKNVSGTFVGFYTPNYAATINVPGFHFHFVSDDKTIGGHILNLAFDEANVQIDPITQFEVQLPQTKEFAEADLTKIQLQDIIDVEGDHKKE
ncbi:acetolactate decarboxylase [Paenibacillus pini]|uniref:Alpha-acetolactate decarboxylase n=1 Tax=Paenibacillus pini JCM 16418 TaxID=1236976 RepID=W7Y8W8_9BACL|nr:acetolactate decarboxylase [Paenibacillus pini]GAF07400.1 alpha-acetolactate decarboxylase [Paenibacillus pini JCM 16418]